MRRTHVALLIAALLHAAPSHGQDYCPQSVTDRPRIGLVLSGGGARGIAHIGVLRVLEQLHIPIDYIAGTSGGAIIGGLYATGMDSKQIEHVIRAIDWSDLFVDDTQRADWPFARKRDDELALFGPKFGVGPSSSLLPKGAINGQKVITYFQGVVSRRVQSKDFDELPIPFRAVAADLATAQPVILDHGDLATAMRISASIPGVFLPMHFEHRLLVDGGIVDNLPVDVVKAMGADIVIAVDVSTPLSSEDQLNDFLAITNQLSNILVVHNTTEEKKLLGPHDVLIEPPLGDQITSIDFDKADLSIPIGYHAADELRTRLAPLGLSQDAYAAYRAGVARCAGGPPRIEFVELDNRSRFDDAVIRKLLHVEIGQPFDQTQLDRDMQQIYALGFLDLATYKIVEKDGRKGIRVSVQQDSRGRNFIETGFDFYGDSGSSAIELRLAYLKTDVDRRGAEFRGLLQVGENQGLLAELYKPMTDSLRLILLPRLFATRRQLDIFDSGGERISQVDIEQGGGSLALGQEFARDAALFGGIRRYKGNIKVEIGDANVPKGEFDGGEWYVDGTFDRLNNRDFPSYGTLAGAEYLWSRQSLDADTDFEQLLGSVLHADTWDRHTLILGSRFGLTMQGTAPTQNLFRGGGIFNLSGYEPDQLTGQNFAMAFVGYRYRLFKSGWLPPYIGTTVEYGNAAEDRQDVFDQGIWNGSVFVAFDLPIGPLYAGWGFAENNHNAFFVRIGNIFGSNALLR